MNSRVFLTLIVTATLFSLGQGSMAQGPGPTKAAGADEALPKPKTKPPVAKKSASAAGPVTRAEAHAVFVRADRLCARILKTRPNQWKVPFKPEASSVSRDEVLLALDGLVNSCSDQFKYRPRDAKFDAKRIRPTKFEAKVNDLIRRGFVSPYGPLTTGKTDTLTLEEFGDAIAFALVGIADRTHTPSQKFSPALMKGQI